MENFVKYVKGLCIIIEAKLALANVYSGPA